MYAAIAFCTAASKWDVQRVGVMTWKRFLLLVFYEGNPPVLGDCGGLMLLDEKHQNKLLNRPSAINLKSHDFHVMSL